MGDFVVYNMFVFMLKIDMVIFGNVFGLMFEIKVGNYCYVGGGVYWNFEDLKVVGLKVIIGQVVSYIDNVKYDKVKNIIFFLNIMMFDVFEIFIKFV